jgi:nicotinate-nucleotide adenylyltransferase
MLASVRVAIFGGSFNPPHLAHVLACVLVLSRDEADHVLVVPAYKHPFAKSLAPFEDRVRMCELAMAWIPRIEISRVEEEIGGESRTLHTIRHLAQTHPAWSLRLVIGSDVLAEAPRWFGFDAITQIAPPLVLERAGVEPAQGSPLLPDVSSTEVRAMIARGAWAEAGKVVPRAVLDHVRSHGLYT